MEKRHDMCAIIFLRERVFYRENYGMHFNTKKRSLLDIFLIFGVQNINRQSLVIS
jgi:hypothetical protein